jgi:hypothetical protein
MKKTEEGEKLKEKEEKIQCDGGEESSGEVGMKKLIGGKIFEKAERIGDEDGCR